MPRNALHPEQDTLFNTIQYVTERSQKLLELCLNQALQIDYMSVYPETEAEYAQNCLEAERRGGKLVFDKNGNVYKLEGTSQPDIIRIRKPWPTNGLVGCADFVVEDYGKTRSVLATREGVKELHKEGYDILEITHPGFDVAIYLPSERMTTYLMGIDNPKN